MTTRVCMTVDVEDFYDGMAELGEPIERPAGAGSGLSGLASRLETRQESVVTLFVVGNYAQRARQLCVPTVTRSVATDRITAIYPRIRRN